ncbi:MAG: hypothetical protein ACJ8GW_01425 [Massilia sp.]
MKRAFLLTCLLAPALALASGDFGPTYRNYKAYTAPTIELDEFQAGRLGVLQPGMQRVYLYTAWRAITLGAEVKQAPGMRGGLARADGSAFDHGWEDGGSRQSFRNAWLLGTGLSASVFGACPASSNKSALSMLATIKTRKDATPERVNQWVAAQELVSLACRTASSARYRANDGLLKVDVPEVLADGVPAYWRQLRAYQRAAALFQSERYADATLAFDQIGATASHPMRQLGLYLALRAQVRLAAEHQYQMPDAKRGPTYAALAQRATGILGDPSLAALHEDTRAMLRSIRVRIVPFEVVADLGHYLADPKADPFANDRLGDWDAALQTLTFSPRREDPAKRGALRAQLDFFDWIDNLRTCAYPDDTDEGCRDQAKHALTQWQRSGSRPWLVATLMLATKSSPALEHAANAVQGNDPAYLTVRYHLARLYRLSGRVEKARGVSDAALALELDPGSRNLFREERFAVARSVVDAAHYLQRIDIDESRSQEDTVLGLNDDALEWLARGISAADMVVVARQGDIDQAIRARLAAAAWIRADLLHQPATALAALKVLAPLAPMLKDDIARYRLATSPSERRHRMLLTALRFGLSAELAMSSRPIEAVEKGDVTASMWCRFKPDAIDEEGASPFPWQLPPAPKATSSSALKAELQTLYPLKTATGFLGDHVLARLKSHPGDPDLPWLLHVVVWSTRGGCLDADAQRLSRTAFVALHKHFPNDEWAKKTRVFY